MAYQHCFFTTNYKLARLYSIHIAKQFGGAFGHGAVFSAQINDLWLYQYDFGGKSSYGPEFRNIIFTFRDFNHKAVLIKNVVDYPSKDMMLFESSDIIVVFDFSILDQLTVRETNIYQP
jgi:hypothetical protein